MLPNGNRRKLLDGFHHLIKMCCKISLNFAFMENAVLRTLCNNVNFIFKRTQLLKNWMHDLQF